MIREARLRRTLFQSIVIYNLAIVIENNGINPIVSGFYCWDQCRSILNWEDPFRYLKIIVCLCVSRKVKDLF